MLVPGAWAPAHEWGTPKQNQEPGELPGAPVWQGRRGFLRGPFPVELQIPGSRTGSALRGQKGTEALCFVLTGSLCVTFFPSELKTSSPGRGGYGGYPLLL